MTIYVFAVLIGVIAGLRAMTAPAAVSLAAYAGRLKLGGTWMAFLGGAYTPWILTAFAIGELVTDQLPKTPSRKVPVQFGTRLFTGGLSGAALCAAGSWQAGAAAGVLGAVIGTMGGAAARSRLAAKLGKDLPAALIEDAVAIGGAAAIILAGT
jgi:uncharacterized membrane protein